MEGFCSLDFSRHAWYNVACNAVVFCVNADITKQS